MFRRFAAILVLGLVGASGCSSEKPKTSMPDNMNLEIPKTASSGATGGAKKPPPATGKVE